LFFFHILGNTGKCCGIYVIHHLLFHLYVFD
jgi:hypothetical protein